MKLIKAIEITTLVFATLLMFVITYFQIKPRLPVDIPVKGAGFFAINFEWNYFYTCDGTQTSFDQSTTVNLAELVELTGGNLVYVEYEGAVVHRVYAEELRSAIRIDSITRASAERVENCAVFNERLKQQY